MGFASATAYMIWRKQWFEVWRHGVPPISYFLTAMVPWVTTLAALGWFVGKVISRRHPA